MQVAQPQKSSNARKFRLPSLSEPSRSRQPDAFSERSDVLPLQTTLHHAISCQGVALHSGVTVTLDLLPAEAGTGIRFFRSDLPHIAPFPVRQDTIVDTRLSTVVASPEDPTARVATIEHLMAALHAIGIDNALISVSGPELPVLDGSAAAFAFLIQCAGKSILPVPRKIIELLRPVRVEHENGAFAELRPFKKGLSLSISLDFDAEAIGEQDYAMVLTPEHFLSEVSFCRTFVNLQDIKYLQSIGLARGGSLDNAIVVDGEKILNPAGLKIEREFARHKLMDAVGDLYCCGYHLQAEFTGHKSGHTLNNKLLRAVFADQRNWRFVSRNMSSSPRASRRTAVAA